jgi:hypothetical protein
MATRANQNGRHLVQHVLLPVNIHFHWNLLIVRLGDICNALRYSNQYLFSSLWWTLIIGFSNDITTFTNEYDSFLFVQQYDSGKDQKKITGCILFWLIAPDKVIITQTILFLQHFLTKLIKSKTENFGRIASYLRYIGYNNFY